MGESLQDRSPLVSCLGIAVEDVIFSLPAFPTHGGKFSADSVTSVGGGVAANGAVAIRRLGGRARLASVLGADARAETIVRELEREGIDCSSVQRIPNLSSPVSAVLVDRSGERIVVNHVAPTLFGRDIDDPEAFLDDAAALLVDGRWPVAASTCVAVAAARNIPSIVDADRPLVGDHRAMIGMASHVIFSRQALFGTTNTTSVGDGLRAIRSEISGWIAVTGGADGVWWLNPESEGPTGVQHLAAEPVDVVDTVGAGDVFHGAFALAIAEQQPIPDALRFASIVAAIKCTRPGGRLGIPYRKELSEHGWPKA